MKAEYWFAVGAALGAIPYMALLLHQKALWAQRCDRQVRLAEERLISKLLRGMTPAEMEAQRRSFVYGNCKIDNPHVTREMVNAAGDALAKKREADNE